MTALSLSSPRHLVSKRVPPPVPAPDEVLLRVEACGLCRTDAKMWRKGHRDLRLPRVPGHEICASDPETGERYVVWPGRSCGECPACLSGRENLCRHMKILGFHADGGFAEWIAVPRESLVPCPADLPIEVATLAEPLACGLNALERLRVTGGERLLIVGGGPVGLLTALAARDAGARVFVAEIAPVRRGRASEFVESLGIEEGADAGDRIFDTALNAAGQIATVMTALDRMRPGGRFCAFSGLPGESVLPAHAWNEIHYRELEVFGAYGCTRRGVHRAIELLAAHRTEAQWLIEAPIALDEVAGILESLPVPEALRYVVRL